MRFGASRPGGIARDCEVGDREDGQRVGAGNVETGRNRPLRPRQRLGRRELAEDLEGRVDHLVAQLGRKEDGRLREPEGNRRAGALRSRRV